MGQSHQQIWTQIITKVKQAVQTNAPRILQQHQQQQQQQQQHQQSNQSGGQSQANAQLEALQREKRQQIQLQLEQKIKSEQNKQAIPSPVAVSSYPGPPKVPIPSADSLLAVKRPLVGGVVPPALVFYKSTQINIFF